jgi:hypothetical protein
VARKPGRPNLDDIRLKTPNLRPPVKKPIKSQAQLIALQGLILQPFTIN